MSSSSSKNFTQQLNREHQIEGNQQLQINDIQAQHDDQQQNVKQWQEPENLRQRYLNNGHNTIYKLYQLRIEILKCQFNHQQEKDYILEIIVRSIRNMYLFQIMILQVCYEGKNEYLKYDGEKYAKNINQYLKKVSIKNNIDHLFKLIQDIIEGNQECVQKYNQVSTKQLILWKNQKRCIGTYFLNENATIVGPYELLYAFNSNHKQIRNFKKVDFRNFIYLKHSQQFLLSTGKRIKILNSKWQTEQQLIAHSEFVMSMIVNQKEDLIITCSHDKIKFWSKDNSFIACQQTLKTNYEMVNLSLSPDEKKLISRCQYPNDPLLVIQQQNDNQWILTQEIKIGMSCEYLSFISNNQFIYKPNLAGFLQVFNYENDTKQFIESELILISNRYSRCDDELSEKHYFNNKTKVLIMSYDYRIYIYHFKDNGSYELQSSIELEQGESFLTFSEKNQLIVIFKQLSKYGEGYTKIIQLRNKI